MIFPCIDLMDGKVVQLVQGREKALEGGAPLEMLRRFKAFPEIQVIDLNAAMGAGSNDRLVSLLAAHARTNTDTFNIAGGGRVTMNQAIQLVEEIAGCRIDVERVPPQSGDVRNTGADLSKSREILGYSPRVSLRDGLRVQIESMQMQKVRVASFG